MVVVLITDDFETEDFDTRVVLAVLVVLMLADFVLEVLVLVVTPSLDLDLLIVGTTWPELWSFDDTVV
jgi:hypothetical protein